MVSVSTLYEGQLRCRAEHGPSQATLVTDAPLDNHGKGESFSPTDLVAVAFGACMKAETLKEMSTVPPRRIASLRTRLTIPLPADHPQRLLLEQAAHACPVQKSLSPEIDAAIEFVWTG